MPRADIDRRRHLLVAAVLGVGAAACEGAARGQVGQRGHAAGDGGQALVPLEPLGPDRFVGKTQLWQGWWVVHAIRMVREGNRVVAMIVNTDRMKDVRLDRVG